MAAATARSVRPVAAAHPRYDAAVKPMYHPADLASMDPLVLMKNLDHVRMTSRRLSYILQQQVHLYAPEDPGLGPRTDHAVGVRPEPAPRR